MSGLGCKHYKRKVKFVTPCCQKQYVCRFCHDENETHPLDRRSIRRVVCMVCNTTQSVRSRCAFCKACFGNYHCLICNLFDDEDKKQFHCSECGICRVGGRNEYFHCPTCNFCLNYKLYNNHKCLPDISHKECTICLEDLHTSRLKVNIPLCGHVIHQKCYDALAKQGISMCPSCKKILEFPLLQ